MVEEVNEEMELIGEGCRWGNMEIGEVFGYVGRMNIYVCGNVCRR